jgi:hypothetical protein
MNPTFVPPVISQNTLHAFETFSEIILAKFLKPSTSDKGVKVNPFKERVDLK